MTWRVLSIDNDQAVFAQLSVATIFYTVLQPSLARACKTS